MDVDASVEQPSGKQVFGEGQYLFGVRDEEVAEHGEAVVRWLREEVGEG